MNAPLNHHVALSAIPKPSLDDASCVLLWSQRQNALHIEPLGRMLEVNRQAYASNIRLDYVPLLIGTDELCHDIAKAVRATLIKRDAARTPGVAV